MKPTALICVLFSFAALAQEPLTFEVEKEPRALALGLDRLRDRHGLQINYEDDARAWQHKGTLKVTYSVDEKPPAATVKQFVEAYGEQGAFTVLEKGAITVVPLVARVFDAKVKLPVKSVSAAEALELVCAAASAAAKTRIVLGKAKHLGSQMVILGAQERPAREQVAEILGQLRLRHSYQLLYSEDLAGYILRIDAVQPMRRHAAPEP
jgi:hypothetical protein